MDNYFSLHIAGVDSKQYPLACGKCISIKCMDEKQCSGSNVQEVTVAVVDDCPGCGPNVISVGAFVPRELSGKSMPEAGALNITWQYTDCQPYGRVWKPPSIDIAPIAAFAVSSYLLDRGIEKQASQSMESSSMKAAAERAMPSSSMQSAGGSDAMVATQAGSSSQTAGIPAIGFVPLDAVDSAPAPEVPRSGATNDSDALEVPPQEEEDAVLLTLADQPQELPAVILPWTMLAPSAEDDNDTAVTLEDVLREHAPSIEEDVQISTKPLEVPQIDTTQIIDLLQEDTQTSHRNASDAAVSNSELTAPSPEPEDPLSGSVKATASDDTVVRAQVMPYDPTEDGGASMMQGSVFPGSWASPMSDDDLQERACGLGASSQYFKVSSCCGLLLCDTFYRLVDCH